MSVVLTYEMLMQVAPEHMCPAPQQVAESQSQQW